MPTTCLVVSCGSRQGRDDVKFYQVPSTTNSKYFPYLNELSKLRRESWIAVLKRDDLTASILRNQKVCSKHFISGKPCHLKDETNPDWVPSQNMGYASQAINSDLNKQVIAHKSSKSDLATTRREKELTPATEACLEETHDEPHDSRMSVIKTKTTMDKNSFAQESPPISGFSKVCRACLKKTVHLYPIKTTNFADNPPSSKVETKVTIVSVFEKYCSINIHEKSKFPQNICRQCIEQAYNAYDFFEMFQQSQILLAEVVKKYKSAHAAKIKTSKQHLSASTGNSIKSAHQDVPNSISQDLPAAVVKVPVAASNKMLNLLHCDGIQHEGSSASMQQDSFKSSATNTSLNIDLSKTNSNVANDSNASQRSKSGDFPQNVALNDTFFVLEYNPAITIENPINTSTNVQLEWTKEHSTATESTGNQLRSLITDVPNIDSTKNIVSVKSPQKVKSEMTHSNTWRQSKLVCRLQQISSSLNPTTPMMSERILHDHTYFKKKSSHYKNRVLHKNKNKFKVTRKKIRLLKSKNMLPKTLKTICHICGKLLMSHYLQRHMKRIHANKKANQTKCQECNKHFLSAYSLMLHMGSHGQGFNMKCRLCPNIFSNLSSYKAHLRNDHEKGFICERCGKAFAFKKSLEIHLSQHHNSKATRVHCNLCDKTMLMNKYRLHIKRTHFIGSKDMIVKEPVKCEICNRQFRSAKVMRLHMWTHGRSYVVINCSLCSKTYNDVILYRKHLNDEHEKRYLCPTCGMGFVLQSTFYRHRRTHNPNFCKRKG